MNFRSLIDFQLTEKTKKRFMTSSLTSSPAMARLHATTGKRELGWTIRGHLREEDDDANSPVQEIMTDDDV
ncbi:Os02g0206833 [Oryza sativa Japonica Group]|uniref:Os02g0206833 protein n=1 Tax=Oryza sativa subsp. japonica TaxID=39947 RepID=A0A0P0VG79_ORYSJ|nr:hypothetical protein EE612_009651 [Oryza sativa]BAS77563.1 Os02g0206833 [Oryza sativa Japonica Group]